MSGGTAEGTKPVRMRARGTCVVVVVVQAAVYYDDVAGAGHAPQEREKARSHLVQVVLADEDDARVAAQVKVPPAPAGRSMSGACLRQRRPRRCHASPHWPSSSCACSVCDSAVSRAKQIVCGIIYSHLFQLLHELHAPAQPGKQRTTGIDGRARTGSVHPAPAQAPRLSCAAREHKHCVSHAVMPRARNGSTLRPSAQRERMRSSARLSLTRHVSAWGPL